MPHKLPNCVLVSWTYWQDLEEMFMADIQFNCKLNTCIMPTNVCSLSWSSLPLCPNHNTEETGLFEKSMSMWHGY